MYYDPVLNIIAIKQKERILGLLLYHTNISPFKLSYKMLNTRKIYVFAYPRDHSLETMNKTIQFHEKFRNFENLDLIFEICHSIK